MYMFLYEKDMHSVNQNKQTVTLYILSDAHISSSVHVYFISHSNL